MEEWIQEYLINLMGRWDKNDIIYFFQSILHFFTETNIFDFDGDLYEEYVTVVLRFFIQSSSLSKS